MNTSPKRSEGSEFFSIRDGERVDSHLHSPILNDPEADINIMADYGDRLKAAGFSTKDIARILGKNKKPPSGSTPQGFARGGPGSHTWNVRSGSHPRQPSGMIKSDIPGRTDKIPMSVPPGSYILPADIPSALGQGNTMAGEKILGNMFKSGPYSPSATQATSGKLPKAKSAMPKISAMPRMRKAALGGEQTGNDPDIPIIAAGGEVVLYPDQVLHAGHGNMEAGHRVLDKFVLGVRKKNIQTLRNLKGPKK